MKERAIEKAKAEREQRLASNRKSFIEIKEQQERNETAEAGEVGSPPRLETEELGLGILKIKRRGHRGMDVDTKSFRIDTSPNGLRPNPGQAQGMPESPGAPESPTAPESDGASGSIGGRSAKNLLEKVTETKKVDADMEVFRRET